MPYVSVTRLRLRSRRFLPHLYAYTWAIVQQARRSDGFLKGRLFRGTDRLLLFDLLYGRHPSYCTMTMWRDREAAMRFRNRGPHEEAMRRGRKWVQEASTAHWTQRSDELPSAPEAHERMREEGRLMPADHPSRAHAAGEIPEDPGFRTVPLTLRPVENPGGTGGNQSLCRSAAEGPCHQGDD